MQVGPLPQLQLWGLGEPNLYSRLQYLNDEMSQSSSSPASPAAKRIWGFWALEKASSDNIFGSFM